MLEFVENYYKIILTTAAVLLGVVSIILEFLIRSRLKKVSKTDSELVVANNELEESLEVSASVIKVMSEIPGLILEAENVFGAKQGSMKIGYVLSQVKALKEKYRIPSYYDFLDYIERILATPEKKGELDVSKAHETSQR